MKPLHKKPTWKCDQISRDKHRAKEIISNARPKVKLGCSDLTNLRSFFASLDEVKFDEKDSRDAEEVNNATAFVKMKTVNHALFLLSARTVRAVGNATVATSAATSMP